MFSSLVSPPPNPRIATLAFAVLLFCCLLCSLPFSALTPREKMKATFFPPSLFLSLFLWFDMASHTRSANSNFSFCFSFKWCSIRSFFSFPFFPFLVACCVFLAVRLVKISTATTLVSIGGGGPTQPFGYQLVRENVEAGLFFITGRRRKGGANSVVFLLERFSKWITGARKTSFHLQYVSPALHYPGVRK